MTDPKLKLTQSRELLEEARTLIDEDNDVHERLRHVLDLTIEAFVHAEGLDEEGHGSMIVRLFSRMK